MKIADMHCDTLSRCLAVKRETGSVDMAAVDLQINFGKMKASGYLLQNFAAFVHMGEVGNPLEEALHMAELFQEQMESNREIIAPVYCWDDIEKNEKAGKISAMLTLEEGGICKGDPDFLAVLYRLGARMMTLTWNYENELGFPNFNLWNILESAGENNHRPRCEDTSGKGLKEQGIYFLEEMERMGIIIDVSHLSDAGFYDVMAHTSKPFVASHSNARSVCRAVRNLTDDMIVRLAERGGVTGINFCKDFLGEPNEGEDYLDQAVRHMRYLVNLGGEDFVGLGSDFDGIEPYDDFADCTVMPRLVQRMEQAGFSQTLVEKICYKNVLRVYREILD